MHVKKKELLKLGLDEEMAKKVEAAIAEMLKNYIPKLLSVTQTEVIYPKSSQIK